MSEGLGTFVLLIIMVGVAIGIAFTGFIMWSDSTDGVINFMGYDYVLDEEYNTVNEDRQCIEWEERVVSDIEWWKAIDMGLDCSERNNYTETINHVPASFIEDKSNFEYLGGGVYHNIRQYCDDGQTLVQSHRYQVGTYNDDRGEIIVDFKCLEERLNNDCVAWSESVCVKEDLNCEEKTVCENEKQIEEDCDWENYPRGVCYYYCENPTKETVCEQERDV